MIMRTAAMDKIPHLPPAPLGWKAAWSGERCPAALSWRSSQIWRRVCCSFTQSCLTLQPHGLQHTKFSCLHHLLEFCSNSCLLSRRCHPTISSFIIPFSSCLQSFLDSGSFPVNRLFTSGGQNIGVSASASVLPMNIQD